MDVISVARQLQAIIDALKAEGQKPAEMAENKARSIMEHKKAKAIATARLRSEGVQVTLIKSLAEGEAAELEYEMNLASDLLKIHFDRTENLRSQMNATQSINRHLSHA